MSSISVPAGVAWVAGDGASLGAAVARRYARGGLTVALNGRTRERIEAVAAAIRAAGGRRRASTSAMS